MLSPATLAPMATDFTGVATAADFTGFATPTASLASTHARSSPITRYGPSLGRLYKPPTANDVACHLLRGTARTPRFNSTDRILQTQGAKREAKMESARRNLVSLRQGRQFAVPGGKLAVPGGKLRRPSTHAADAAAAAVT